MYLHIIPDSEQTSMFITDMFVQGGKRNHDLQRRRLPTEL